MSAIGFDIRNESCVVAVAKQNSIVCFDEEQRFLGIAGAATSTENLRNSISLIMRLIIGRSFSDPELQQDLKSLPFSVSEGADGFPLIHARYRGETKSFTPIQVQESFPFPIALQWKSFSQDSCNGKTDNLRSCIVFSKGNPIPSVKALTFYRAGTFTVDVQYADAGELQAPPKINTYTIGPFQSTNGERCKVKVKVRLNLHGYVSVEAALLFEEVKTVVPIPLSMVMVEPLKEITKMGMEKGLTEVEVDKYMTLPNT